MKRIINKKEVLFNCDACGTIFKSDEYNYEVRDLFMPDDKGKELYKIFDDRCPICKKDLSYRIKADGSEEFLINLNK